jgi:26S proteasome regulatory subunit N3
MTAAALAKADKVEDVEMKEAGEEEKAVEKKDPNLLTVEDIREHCKLIRRSVETKETRFMLRVLRALPATRRKVNPVVLRSVLKTFYTAEGDRTTKEGLLRFLAPADEMEGTPSRGKASATPLYPEVDFYMNLLVLIHLIDGGAGEEALQCATEIVTKLCGQNRRTLDLISAKCFFYFMRAHEMVSVDLVISSWIPVNPRWTGWPTAAPCSTAASAPPP